MKKVLSWIKTVKLKQVLQLLLTLAHVTKSYKMLYHTAAPIKCYKLTDSLQPTSSKSLHCQRFFWSLNVHKYIYGNAFTSTVANELYNQGSKWINVDITSFKEV